MSSNCALGTFRVPREDGVDDLDVFRRGCRCTPRKESQPELVLRRLRTQSLEDLRRCGMAADPAHACVEFLVEAAVAHEVALTDRRLDATAKTVQLRRARVVELLRSPPGDESFELCTHFDDLNRLVDRDRADPRAAVGKALDQSFTRQTQQRAAHRRSRRVELLAQVSFDQSLARHELARKDCVAQALGDVCLRSGFRPTDQGDSLRDLPRKGPRHQRWNRA